VVLLPSCSGESIAGLQTNTTPVTILGFVASPFSVSVSSQLQSNCGSRSTENGGIACVEPSGSVQETVEALSRGRFDSCSFLVRGDVVDIVDDVDVDVDVVDVDVDVVDIVDVDVGGIGVTRRFETACPVRITCSRTF